MIAIEFITRSIRTRVPLKYRMKGKRRTLTRLSKTTLPHVNAVYKINSVMQLRLGLWRPFYQGQLSIN